jgi:SpoVK/Ycf46/Vps4 family AAA+-type ATPase
MLILTTSNPSELDEAVLDRMDEHIHLPIPSSYERYSILNNAFSRSFCPVQTTSSRNYLSFLSNPSPTAKYSSSFHVERALSKIAQDSYTGGFSGRELKKFVQMIVYKCHASDSCVLDYSMWKKETMTLSKTFAAKHLLWQARSQHNI